MNVQCAVLVVYPAHKLENTSLIPVEANFSLVKLFVMDKECTMRAPSHMEHNHS